MGTGGARQMYDQTNQYVKSMICTSSLQNGKLFKGGLFSCNSNYLIWNYHNYTLLMANHYNRMIECLFRRQFDILHACKIDVELGYSVAVRTIVSCLCQYKLIKNATTIRFILVRACGRGWTRGWRFITRPFKKLHLIYQLHNFKNDLGKLCSEQALNY